MAPLVLAAALWRAAVPLTVPHGEARVVALPPVPPPARLVFRMRADYPRAAGSNLFLRLLVNGAEVGLMRDRRTSRLVGAAPVFGPSLEPFAFGRWRVAYGPSAGDALVLDVSDLLRSGAPNEVTFEHGPASGAGSTPLVVEDLRLERGEASPGATCAPRRPPDDAAPRAAFRAALHGAGRPRSGRGRVDDRVAVRTVVRGGPHDRRRAIVATPTHRRGATRSTTPRRSGSASHPSRRPERRASVHLGGRTEPDVADAYDQWN
jgi:hypothetical protein